MFKFNPDLPYVMPDHFGIPYTERSSLLYLDVTTIAVGYLTESLHGAGSPQAQRIQIGRQMELDFKKGLARRLAGIDQDDD